MASRTHSTLDGHTKVTERRATQIFPASGYIFFYNTKSQATPFADWTTKRSKILPYDTLSPDVLEYILDANQGFFEEDGTFDFTLMVARWTRLINHCALMPACRVWLSLHPVYSAYHLLGAFAYYLHL